MRKILAIDLVYSAKRIRENGPKKPTKSFKELCDEFEVKPRTLSNYLRREGAPKPLIKHHTQSSCNSYYDPDEMRKWWKGLQK